MGEPSTPKSKRGSLQGLFEGLQISPSTKSPPSSSKSKNLATWLTNSMRGGWPPSLRKVDTGFAPPLAMPFTIRMSADYRIYDDHWRIDSSVKDQPVDVSTKFQATKAIMSEIDDLLRSKSVSEDDVEAIVLNEMAAAVFASNRSAKVGLDLEETFKICMKVFKGEVFEYSERSLDYQRRLDEFFSGGKASKPLGKVAIRSRREVVQHAAAFQHIVAAFVKDRQPLTEELIKETHRILTEGLSGDGSGVFGTRSFSGTYRQGNQQAFVGTHQFTKPPDISKAMKSMVESLQTDLSKAEKSDSLDPFALAAKYCDRMINIHLFQDGNGRMCRLILNTILMKYAGVTVGLGEKGQDRTEYLLIAGESSKVGGHSGQLATMVLESAHGTLTKLKNKLQRKASRAADD